MLIFLVALSNSTLVIALQKTRAKPIQTPKTPSCICSFWDKKVMREFLRKNDMRKFLYLETTKAGAKTPALSIRHIGICKPKLNGSCHFVLLCDFNKADVYKHLYDIATSTINIFCHSRGVSID